MSKKPTLPSDSQAEDAVISYLLAQESFESLFSAQGAGVTSKAFLEPLNAYLWEAIESLSNTHESFSLAALTTRLKEKNMFEQIGGAIGLSKKLEYVGQIAFVQSCARIVSLAVRRDIFQVCKVGALKSCDESLEIDMTLGELDLGVANIGKSSSGDTTLAIADIHKDVMPEVEKMLDGNRPEDGVHTGYPSIDRLTNGLQRGSMVVIGARPSVGKTSLALNIIENVLRRNGSCLFFSLEMDAKSIFKKLVCSAAEVSLSRVIDNLISADQKNELRIMAGRIRDSKFWINDNSDLSINQIRSIARQRSHRTKLDLIVVDYLQFIRVPDGGKDGRVQAVSEISRGLKAMAKELNVPVLVLSQLSRDSDKGDRRPKLSDLRDSGSIEQDLDLGLLLWPNRDDQTVEVIVAKNRMGATGLIKMVFKSEITKFVEATYEAQM